MILTAENYFSKEADKEYMSVSQYKAFAGTFGRLGCEAQAMAKLNGEWEDKKTTSLLVGSYVDAHFEGTLDLFKAQNPEIFTKQNGLKAEYRNAENIISRIERDEYFMQHMKGEKQVIMTAELFGIPWKIKMDVYFPGELIVDLKIMKSIRDSFWSADSSRKNFIEYWGYDIQAAIYQKIVELNTGHKLPFKIAAASKEEYPDIEIIQIEQSVIDHALNEVEKNISNVIAVKNGEYEPVRCERCDYCKHTRKLTDAIWSGDLLLEV